MDLKQEKSYIEALYASKPRVVSIIVRSKNNDLYQKIQQISGGTFSEKAYKWINDLTNSPSCYCGNSLKFLDYGRGYTKYCSPKCVANSLDIHEKKKLTSKLKFGVDHFSKTKEYKEKFTNTCQKRYGVNNPGQITKLKKQRARTKQHTFFSRVLTDIAKQVKPQFDFSAYTHLRDHNLPWKCLTCDTEFTSNLLNRRPTCPTCFPSGNFGRPKPN